MIQLKSRREIDKMRQAGRVVALVHQALRERVRPGVSTQELDELAERIVRDNGGIPAFKGYKSGRGPAFPATLCTSVNEQVVHGIPGPDSVLQDGDIVSCDVGVQLDGFFADGAVTLPVGQVSEEALRLLSATEQSLHAGIRALKPGARLGDVSAAIQRVAEEAGFGVVREFVGHGIGRALHEDPQVPNYGRPGTGPVIQPGMVLAIEPMINAGTPDVQAAADGWTVLTADGKWSAHFEHTIAVTDEGAEILTVVNN